MPVVEAELSGRLLVDGVGELAEQERLAERRRKVAVVLREVHGIDSCESGGRRDVHTVRPVLIVPLVRPEEEESVAHDGATRAESRDVAGEVRLLKRWVPALPIELEGVERNEILVLVTEEHVARPVVATRTRRRSNDGSSGFLVFRLEILRDHAVLLNRAARERIAAAVILASHSALGEVILEAGSVHKHVG